ncbi:uncharacterized protein LOC131224832 [Magnolia sinica]|uniref:uncharacterized protein LOC131224832 n=1 Tax=Magnolia sinica TaxID=86752 RepID=UPI00265A085B|nr:uncharacterized protein LOC131224832 [Magnolia sinica]
MARFLLLCLLLAHVFKSLAVEHEPNQKFQPLVESKEPIISAPPTSSATIGHELETEPGVAEAPGNRRLGKHHHTDKSVAGAGVILGGLATAIIATVFCYIRVTRRRNGEN